MGNNISKRKFFAACALVVLGSLTSGCSSAVASKSSTTETEAKSQYCKDVEENADLAKSASSGDDDFNAYLASLKKLSTSAIPAHREFWTKSYEMWLATLEETSGNSSADLNEALRLGTTVAGYLRTECGIDLSADGTEPVPATQSKGTESGTTTGSAYCAAIGDFMKASESQFGRMPTDEGYEMLAGKVAAIIKVAPASHGTYWTELYRYMSDMSAGDQKSVFLSAIADEDTVEPEVSTECGIDIPED